MRYTVHIAFETDSDPTDLELGDLLTTVSECFQDPRIESPDGYFVSADYTIDTYDMEMYDTKGRRVWRYRYGESPNDALIVEHGIIAIPFNREEKDLFESVFPLDNDEDEVAVPPAGDSRDWRVLLRRFFGF
jgi:hypothetical protein